MPWQRVVYDFDSGSVTIKIQVVDETDLQIRLSSADKKVQVALVDRQIVELYQSINSSLLADRKVEGLIRNFEGSQFVIEKNGVNYTISIQQGDLKLEITLTPHIFVDIVGLIDYEWQISKR